MTREERKRLESAIGKARGILEEDYREALEGRYGIHLSGRIEETSRLALPAGEQVSRAELVGIVDHLRAHGLDAGQAVTRLLREAVFTTLNRLVAIRVAEAIGLLPESLGSGKEY